MNNTLTLGELRYFINADTNIWIVCDETHEKIEITKNYLLWGTTGFAEIPILPNDICAIGKNKIEIWLKIPAMVFAAWKKYSEEG